MKPGFLSIILLILLNLVAYGQSIPGFEFNKEYTNIKIEAATPLSIKMEMRKGGLYQFNLVQRGIDVALVLKDAAGKQLLEHDSPNGKNGPEIFEYAPLNNGQYTLDIKRFEEEGNTATGIVSFYVKSFSKAEIALKEKTKKELVVENAKNLLTADIDHFWEAYDQLKNCKTYFDSLTCFQNLYLDRATDGLVDFIQVRDFTAEKFVESVRKDAADYERVRENTLEVKKAEPLIDEVFNELKAIYPNFKPFKACFAIGFYRTGGTVSSNFVLIGTEMTANGQKEGLAQRVKNIVAHECVHTQQPNTIDTNAIVCPQLYGCLSEGAANFISELVNNNMDKSDYYDYGELHEKELWDEFKSTLCAENAKNWLYNGGHSKDRPADLGYYIGYKICQAYYNNAKDKKQAVSDIIEMDDPIGFLQKSGYDKQKKKG